MPAERKADSVITFGIERSMAPPPVVMTNICPSATIARNEAFVLVAIKLSRLRLCANNPKAIHIASEPPAAQIQGISFTTFRLSGTDVDPNLILHPFAEGGSPESQSRRPLGPRLRNLSQV